MKFIIYINKKKKNKKKKKKKKKKEKKKKKINIINYYDFIISFINSYSCFNYLLGLIKLSRL